MKQNYYRIVIFAILILFAASLCSAAEPRMVNPMQGVITSPYGWRTHPITGTRKYHSGVDIGADYGQPIVAAAAGTVTTAGWVSGYGNTIIINHGDGVETLYGHNQSLAVHEGQTVTQGQLIAYCGSSGNSTGPHCHFEVYKNNQIVDPGDYCPELGSGAVNADGVMMEAPDMTWDPDFDFAKYLTGDDSVIHKVVKAASEGVKLLESYLVGIIIALMTIDLALEAMFKTLSPDESGGKILNWLISKFIWFSLLLYVLRNWGDIFGNWLRSFFTESGATMAGVSLDIVEKAFTDPTAILQKGYHLAAPLVTDINKYHTISSAIANMATLGMNIVLFVVLIAIFSIMTIQILYAFVEFYLLVLFSFVSFVFAGSKYTQKFGANGINGLMAGFIQLMYFCFYSVFVQSLIENLVVDSSAERSLNFTIMMTLVLVSMALLYMGARVRKLILDQFGSVGFQFTN